MNSFLDNRPFLAGKNGSSSTATLSTDANFQPLFNSGLGAKPGTDTIPAAEMAAPADSEPHVELVQNAGRVERIIVTCTCCNKIELQCQY